MSGSGQNPTSQGCPRHDRSSIESGSPPAISLCRRSANSQHMRRSITCSYSITSTASNKKDTGDGKADYLLRQDGPMMYMIQIDCENDVIITEGDAAR